MWFWEQLLEQGAGLEAVWMHEVLPAFLGAELTRLHSIDPGAGLQGYLSCSLQGAFYFKSQSNRAVPKITAKEIEALRYCQSA